MPSNHSRTSRQNRRASVTSKLDEVITSASETAPDHAAESRLGDDGIEYASALTDRAGVEAALEPMTGHGVRSKPAPQRLRVAR